MHYGEAFVAAYYERVKGYATITNVRFPGPSGRNWSDLDVVAIPLAPIKHDEKQPAKVIQVKWRAKFTLQEEDNDWLDTSVVNPKEVHEAIAEKIGDWPYYIVLVTTNLWLEALGDRKSLCEHLSTTAQSMSKSCQGVEIQTFEEIATDWRDRLGEAVQGWAEDPFSFHLQVLQRGGIQPPSKTNLPPDPEISDAATKLIIEYEHSKKECRDAAQDWLQKLVEPKGIYKLKYCQAYESKNWKGIQAGVWGGTWIFIGTTGAKQPIFYVWYKEEQFQMPITDKVALQKASRRFYSWWHGLEK